jgi:hypothetical protein
VWFATAETSIRSYRLLSAELAYFIANFNFSGMFDRRKGVYTYTYAPRVYGHVLANNSGYKPNT